MKKTAFLLALLLLTGCSQKSDNSEISEPIGDVRVGDVQVGDVQIGTSADSEPNFKVYTDDDFTDIDVQRTLIDSEAPVNVTNYDTSWIKFEERRSPCTYEEHRDDFFGDYLKSCNDEETEEKRRSDYDEVCDKFIGGTPRTVQIFDGKLYVVVDYDLMHDRMSHNLSLMEYDLEKKTSREVYSISSRGRGYSIDSINMVDGELVIRQCDSESVSYLAAEYDENGRIKQNEQLLIIREDGSTEEYPQKKIENEYSEMPVFRGEVMKSEDRDDRTVSVSCGSFRLDTSLKSASLETATRSSLVFLKSTINSDTLYVYNFDKMERYIIDAKGMAYSGCITPIGDLLMMTTRQNNAALLIPQIGAYYFLDDISMEDIKAHIIHFDESQTIDKNWMWDYHNSVLTCDSSTWFVYKGTAHIVSPTAMERTEMPIGGVVVYSEK